MFVSLDGATPAPPPLPPAEPVGIECRRCGCTDLRVWKTRPAYGGKVRRTRLCRHCGATVITTEKPEG